MKNMNNRELDVINYYKKIWASTLNSSGLCENLEAENARHYGRFSGIEKLILDFVTKHPHEHESILVLGCGSGEELVDVQGIYSKAKIIGIDTSSDALYKARRIATNSYVMNASAFHLPFNGRAKFDGLVAGQLFDFFTQEDLRTLFEQFSPYTDRGARLYVAIHGYPEDDSWLQTPSEFDMFLSENKEWEVISRELYHYPELSWYSKGIFIIAEKL